MSGGVVGIDTDVLVGQIGGPEFTRTRSLMKIDANGELRLLDIGVCGGLVEIGSATAIPTDWQIAEGDVDALWVNLSAGVSDSSDEATPVGIAAGPGGFDQR